MDEVEYKLKKRNAVLAVNVSFSNVTQSFCQAVINIKLYIHRLTHILITNMLCGHSAMPKSSPRTCNLLVFHVILVICLFSNVARPHINYTHRKFCHYSNCMSVGYKYLILSIWSVVCYSVTKYSLNFLQAVSKLIDIIQSKGAPHSGKIEEVKSMKLFFNV